MPSAGTEMVGSFDYSCQLLDGDQYYVVVEFKIPKGVPANLRHEHLQRLADQFEKGLHG